MVTDKHGNPITAEIQEGLQTYFDGNDKTKQLCITPTSLFFFQIDRTYEDEHGEEAEIYQLFLPPAIDDLIWPVAVGDIITFSKQYGTKQIKKYTTTEHVSKDFRVVSIKKIIRQDTEEYQLEITVDLIPVEKEG